MDPNEVLGEKTRFNIPAVILHFKDTKVKAQIQGHCLRVLHDRGFLEEEVGLYSPLTVLYKKLADLSPWRKAS